MLLADKRILVTGVLNDASIAFSVARRAQEEGAEVVLTSFGRAMSLTERAARRLPDPDVQIVELDVTDADDLDALAGDGRRHARRRAARDRLRAGVVPRRRLPRRAVGRRRGRAAGLGVLAEGARGRRAAADGGGRVDRRARLRQRRRRVAGLRLDGRGEGRVRVDRALPRARPRPAGHPREPRRRGPDPHDRGEEHPRLRAVRGACGPSARRSAGTSRTPSRSPRPCVALLSDWFPATTGEIVHVDGGFHAVGA